MLGAPLMVIQRGAVSDFPLRLRSASVSFNQLREDFSTQRTRRFAQRNAEVDFSLRPLRKPSRPLRLIRARPGLVAGCGFRSALEIQLPFLGSNTRAAFETSPDGVWLWQTRWRKLRG